MVNEILVDFLSGSVTPSYVSGLSDNALPDLSGGLGLGDILLVTASLGLLLRIFGIYLKNHS